jgi:hypothetical protein
MNRLLLFINRLARRNRRSQRPRVYLKVIGVLVGLALAILILPVILIVIFRLNLPEPTDAAWLYRYQAKFETKVIGDQQIGGGYMFVFDGRDLWLRFRVKEPSLPTTPQGFEACRLDEIPEIRQWFLENVRDRSSFLSSLNPWVNPSEIDLQSLNDLNNLRCFKAGEIDNKLGQLPLVAGWWMLYNSKTRLLYLRYANYN